MTNHDEDGLRAQVPADIDTPDTIAYGLTFRQLAIIGGAALAGWVGWRLLSGLIPGIVLLCAAVPLAAVTVAVALGRRDGLPLDRWLLAAISARRAPSRLASQPAEPATLPGWAPPVPSGLPTPGLLRLPADAIAADGTLALGDGRHVALVACSTVNASLRTEAEQAALIDAFGRWLNSLAEPVQIVATAQPVDLHQKARRLQETAAGLPDPALEAAALDHAAWLAELAEERHPLRRTSTIVCWAGTGRDAARTGQRTTRSLAGLGVAARVLDAPTVSGCLAAAVDPYTPPADTRRAAADTPVRARPPAAVDHHLEDSP
ncbi:PrgI family protein [Actinocatenispora rupis]|uniref:PrgI family protein n=1 Tax=Actinocatenispora rupis TaxID=519421 RepID=A0A8J3J6E2_9ACTN|nr:PrgI family protein [Actinocatenispora rupis]GID10228.1 hypothetical protein Aru02nite_11170 [Actinocatenispora rupis]